jgi:hypothetical protein
LLRNSQSNGHTPAFRSLALFVSDRPQKNKFRTSPNLTSEVRNPITNSSAAEIPTVENAPYFFLFAAFSSITACAAANREIGTRNGDALT